MANIARDKLGQRGPLVFLGMLLWWVFSVSFPSSNGRHRSSPREAELQTPHTLQECPHAVRDLDVGHISLLGLA